MIFSNFIFLVISLGLTIDTLTYQNLLQIILTQRWWGTEISSYRTLPSSPCYAIICTRITSIYIFQTQQYMIVIMLYNLMSFKECERRRADTYWQSSFITLLVTIFGSVHFFLWLPFGIISLLQHSVVLPPTFVVLLSNILPFPML